jgi:hypothetical protein
VRWVLLRHRRWSDNLYSLFLHYSKPSSLRNVLDATQGHFKAVRRIGLKEQNPESSKHQSASVFFQLLIFVFESDAVCLGRREDFALTREKPRLDL